MTYDYGTSSPGTGTPSSGGWPADEQPTTQLPPVPAGTHDLPSTGSAGSGGQTVDVAKDEAMGVAGSAKEKGGDLLGEGVDQARSVAGEAGRQARDLMDEARVELAAQAYDQQQRVAGGLRTFGQELSSMAEHSSEGGLAADLARQLASRSTDLAQWLDDREPGSVLDEVKEFARRRPGAFLAIAAGAGVLAGRLTRGLKDAQEEGGAQRPAAQRSTPSHLATQPPERVTAWPATGVQQEGAGYATTGYAGYPSGVTADEATTAGEYGTAGSGYGGTAGSGYGGAAGSGYGGAGAGAYDDAGYGTGADETADPLDAPLRPDPATDPDALPRNEEGWR